MSDRNNPLVEGSALYRRVSFLINEARHGEKRDQVITFTMRVLSNHATIGKDAGSSKINDENHTVSSGAFELLQTVSSLRDWHTKTINEHP